jgi:hypothetical protein
LVHDALFRVRLPTLPTLPPITIPRFLPAPPNGATGESFTFTAGINYAWHVNLVGTPDTSIDRTLQVQISQGEKLQRIFQISYNLDNQQTQVLVGAQANSPDLELVKKLLKLNGFVQIVAGVASTGAPASAGFVAQPSAGGQLTLTFKSVQFAIQAAPSITIGPDTPTGEINATGQVGFQF